jgi:hypothetical protein
MQRRLYPNLNPSAAISVNRDEIATLRSFFGEYRMTRPDFRGQLLPNSRFVFVTNSDGHIQMHQRYRHPVLANGRSVLYAGEAEFRHGRLRWWSNSSGNYRPDARHAGQAGLPMDRFLTYEEVRAGVRRPPADLAEAPVRAASSRI